MRVRFAVLIALRRYRGKKIDIKHKTLLSEISYNLIPAPMMCSKFDCLKFSFNGNGPYE